MKAELSLLAISLLAISPLVCAGDVPARRPNILVILADDLGYADVGFNGGKDVPTPHLDSLAKAGVRCASGYVTHPFCSPTRAGLLTGRYQQRFGHENNPIWLPQSTVAGLPLSQTTLPQVLKTAGYVTGCVGKWHLGAHPQFHPNRRGFDEYFGLLGGGHMYLPGGKGSGEYQIPMDRNGRSEPLAEYLTTALGREGAAFITRHKGQPWFLYLACNAPHTPLQVTDPLLERVQHVTDPTRRGYAGLIVGLDDAVGVAMNALKESGQVENTLVFFLSDNGGGAPQRRIPRWGPRPVGVTHSDNTPLRGAKGQVFEGGIRVPYLTGARTGAPQERLFWRTGGGAKFAVREGDWKGTPNASFRVGDPKLVGGEAGGTQLFNLAVDVGENKDLATAQPEVFARLSRAYADWNRDNLAPLFQSPPANKPKAAKKAQAK